MFRNNIIILLICNAHFCVLCQTISNSQQKEPAVPIEVPSRPWKVLVMDIFVQGNKYYLLIADYYSKFPYAQKMSSISSKKVISTLSVFFQYLAL